jgi:diphthamide synthase (EF-2-diphthine--ammonia ligase)
MFKKMGFKGCFPLWEKTTREQIQAFLDSGLKAYVVCVDSAILDHTFVGKPLDSDFLDRLPSYVDPCGEYGEYHTFVYDGPMFREPVKCRIGEVVLRESLYFSDVIPE